MQMSNLNFSKYFISNYPLIRKQASDNVRKYHELIANTEITFNEIFEKIASTYNLSETQVNKLKEWELEGEKEWKSISNYK